MKRIKSKKVWILLLVFGTVFALGAISVFVLSLCGIKVFSTVSAGGFFSDLFFLISALILSALIVTVSLFLRPED